MQNVSPDSMLNAKCQMFDPISLEEMGGIRLMNRIDTKFVTTLPMLLRLLDMAKDDYWVQEIDGVRNLSYDTTYFDTPDFDMFRKHQVGHTGRQKLRFRTYVISDLQFMEIKTKNNHGRTRKVRMEVGDMDLSDSSKIDFIGKHLGYAPEELRPSLRNNFNRITLVNRAKTERLTIDSGLWFNGLTSGMEREMGPLVVIELKRDGLCFSPVLSMLNKLRIKPHGFSKYCMGLAFTTPGLRVNRFKPKLRWANALIEN